MYQKANREQSEPMAITNSKPQLANLDPLAQLTAGRLPERISRLVIGLWLYGLSIALMIEGAVGAAPWDVFHVGVARHLPLTLGVIIILTAGVVLAAWIPLRQKPGLGTVLNTVLLGPFADLNLVLLPTPDAVVARYGYAIAGVVVCALATALYVGAQLGPGPRDGLMTGLARRTGWPLRRVRTGIEVSVLATGFVLGGTVGLGTVVFAFAVGPLTQFFLRYLTVPVVAAAEATGAPPARCPARSPASHRAPPPRRRRR
ncbi:hypothetical protein FIV07_20245 [Mycobacterium sp. THAF192]|nr:hypothetical protein FIV07_20245 [Mycobacterium sp. THAF192]